MKRTFKWIFRKITQRGYFSSNDINHYLKYDYSFQMLKNFKNDQEPILTSVKIKFKEDLELGVSQSKVVSVFGKPKFVYKNKSIRGHSILFYKKIINGLKTNIIIHLYNDSFFLGIYFIKADLYEFKGILDQLKKEYSIGAATELQKNDIIEDGTGNFIKVDDYKYLALGFFNAQNRHYNDITSQILANKDIKTV
jgi:hypothetical protein